MGEPQQAKSLAGTTFPLPPLPALSHHSEWRQQRLRRRTEARRRHRAQFCALWCPCRRDQHISGSRPQVQRAAGSEETRTTVATLRLQGQGASRSVLPCRIVRTERILTRNWFPELFHVHRQSAYLLGRDRIVCLHSSTVGSNDADFLSFARSPLPRNLLYSARQVADIPIDHPSTSKQHAVLQYRQAIERSQFGETKSMTKSVFLCSRYDSVADLSFQTVHHRPRLRERYSRQRRDDSKTAILRTQVWRWSVPSEIPPLHATSFGADILLL